METLVNISGGVDSMYCAWKVLKENKEETFLLHHVLRDKNIRVRKEKTAVDSCLRYFRNEGLINFKYVENTCYKLGEGVKTIQDIEMVGIFTAIILRSFPSIKKVVISANKEDLVQGRLYDLRSKTRFETIHALSRNKEVEYLYPIKDLTKKEITKLIPRNLLKVCWSCRKPDVNGIACGKCQPCRRMSGLK